MNTQAPRWTVSGGMRSVHGCGPHLAVRLVPFRPYNVGMNSSRIFPFISVKNVRATAERLMFLEARAAKARALEQWENEGGLTARRDCDSDSSRPSPSMHSRTGPIP